MNGSRLKIAFISPIPVFPTIGGNRERQFTLCKALKAAGHEIHFFLLPSRKMGEYDKGAHSIFFGESGFTQLKREGVSDLIYILRRSVLKLRRYFTPGLTQSRREGLSYIDESFYDPFYAQLSTWAKTEEFDCAIVTYATFSRALLAFGPRVHKIIDTHDNIEDFVAREEERKGFLRADTVAAIQEQEADLFREVIGPIEKPRIKVLSHIIDVHAPLDTSSCEGATFIGSSFLANLKSIKFFIDDILPQILRSAPEFKLFVGGSICNDIEDSPSIVKLGFVKDMSDAFVRAPISINPIIAGTGVKIKLLDSLGMGLPVVSTEFGVLGLPKDFMDGVTVVGDSDTRAFAQAVLTLYFDRDERRAMGARAYANAIRWNAIQEQALSDLLVK